MKPQTPEEMLNRFHKQIVTEYGVASIHTVNFPAAYLKQATLAIQEGMRQSIKYALEDVNKTAQVMFEGDDYKTLSIDEADLLSRYESIIKELGL